MVCEVVCLSEEGWLWGVRWGVVDLGGLDDLLVCVCVCVEYVRGLSIAF